MVCIWFCKFLLSELQIRKHEASFGDLFWLHSNKHPRINYVYLLSLLGHMEDSGMEDGQSIDVVN